MAFSRKSQESCREYKLMLEVYKGASKEQRDKVQLMASERKAKMEVEELKAQLASNTQESTQNPQTPGPANSLGGKFRLNAQESQASSTPDRKLAKTHEALIEECKKQLASTKQVCFFSHSLHWGISFYPPTLLFPRTIIPSRSFFIFL